MAKNCGGCENYFGSGISHILGVSWQKEIWGGVAKVFGWGLVIKQSFGVEWQKIEGWSGKDFEDMKVNSFGMGDKIFLENGVVKIF